MKNKLFVLFMVLTILFSGCSDYKIVKQHNEKGDTVILSKDDGSRAFDWQIYENTEDKILTIKTVKGKIKFKLYESDYSDLLEKNIDKWNDSVIDTVAENMFVQIPKVSENRVEYKETDLGCIYGALGFVVDGNNVSDSLVIVTAKEMNGQSSLFLKANCDDEKRISLYEKYGGVPEYEGRIVVFGQMIEGSEILDEIVNAETNGYVNGFKTNEPIVIKSFEIEEAESVTQD